MFLLMLSVYASAPLMKCARGNTHDHVMDGMEHMKVFRTNFTLIDTIAFFTQANFCFSEMCLVRNSTIAYVYKLSISDIIVHILVKLPTEEIPIMNEVMFLLNKLSMSDMLPPLKCARGNTHWSL